MIVESELLIKNPIVSVIIITYNQEDYIVETIESILSQETTSNFELIIGDDFSLDRTRKICLDYQRTYPHIIKLLLQDKNVGLLENYKNVIQLCKGEYISQCAGDDFWSDRRKLDKQLDFLNNNIEYGLIHSAYFLRRNDETHICMHNQNSYSFDDLLIHNHICAPTVMVRKKLVVEYFRFIGISYYCFLMEDYPLWLYVSYMTKIAYIQEPLATYRQLNQSVSNIVDPKKDIEFQISVFQIKEFYIYRFCLNKELLRTAAEDFYIKALHVCYSLKLYVKFEELKIAVKYWSITLPLLNRIRLLSLKNKYFYCVLRCIFVVKNKMSIFKI